MPGATEKEKFAPPVGMPTKFDPSFNSVGREVGLEIWRVEKLAIVKKDSTDPCHQGRFFEGDSYIVLQTKMRVNAFECHIFFWLGKESSQDEQGVAAYKTVELDMYLGGEAVQHREVQGGESLEFQSLFKNGLHYMEGGIESGFKHVDREAFSKRLLQVKGRRYIRTFQVPLEPSSLNCGDVYILDVGRQIFQWNGRQSSNLERIKALEVTKQIRDQERSGRATITIIDQGKDDDSKFWTAFGCPRPTRINSAEEGGDDESVSTKSVDLYRISNESGTMDITPTEERPLKKEHLDTNDAFILDCGSSGIFVWVGKGSNQEEKLHSMKMGVDFINSKGYPNATPVVRVVENAETPLFKQNFFRWPEKEETNLLSRGPSVNNSAPKRPVPQFDVKKMHSSSRPESQGLLPDDGSGTLTIWRIENLEPVVWPVERHGEFYSGDSFVVLYKYGGRVKERSIIYFWQGLESTQDELMASARFAVELDNKLRGAAVQIRVVQNKEPPHFYLIFKGKMIVHKGGKASSFKNRDDKDVYFEEGQSRMFRVRGTSPLNTRAIEVDLSATSLSSGDVFIVETPNTIYLWIGSGSSDDEKNIGHSVLARLSQKEPVAIEEGKETEEFWAAIGGQAPYAHIQEAEETYKPPRLFQCSNARGYFFVEEIFDFAQEDLIEDDVMMLDTYREVFIWIGNQANKEERERASTTAQEYINSDQSGRNHEDTVIITVKQGFEPVNFTGHFPSWDARKLSKSYDTLKSELIAEGDSTESDEKSVSEAALASHSKWKCVNGKWQIPSADDKKKPAPVNVSSNADASGVAGTSALANIENAKPEAATEAPWKIALKKSGSSLESDIGSAATSEQKPTAPSWKVPLRSTGNNVEKEVFQSSAATAPSHQSSDSNTPWGQGLKSTGKLNTYVQSDMRTETDQVNQAPKSSQNSMRSSVVPEPPWKLALKSTGKLSDLAQENQEGSPKTERKSAETEPPWKLALKATGKPIHVVEQDQYAAKSLEPIASPKHAPATPEPPWKASLKPTGRLPTLAHEDVEPAPKLTPQKRPSMGAEAPWKVALKPTGRAIDTVDQDLYTGGQSSSASEPVVVQNAARSSEPAWKSALRSTGRLPDSSVSNDQDTRKSSTPEPQAPWKTALKPTGKLTEEVAQVPPSVNSSRRGSTLPEPPWGRVALRSTSTSQALPTAEAPWKGSLKSTNSGKLPGDAAAPASVNSSRRGSILPEPPWGRVALKSSSSYHGPATPTSASFTTAARLHSANSGAKTSLPPSPVKKDQGVQLEKKFDEAAKVSAPAVTEAAKPVEKEVTKSAAAGKDAVQQPEEVKPAASEIKAVEKVPVKDAVPEVKQSDVKEAVKEAVKESAPAAKAVAEAVSEVKQEAKAAAPAEEKVKDTPAPAAQETTAEAKDGEDDNDDEAAEEETKPTEGGSKKKKNKNKKKKKAAAAAQPSAPAAKEIESAPAAKAVAEAVSEMKQEAKAAAPVEEKVKETPAPAAQEPTAEAKDGEDDKDDEAAEEETKPTEGGSKKKKNKKKKKATAAAQPSAPTTAPTEAAAKPAAAPAPAVAAFVKEEAPVAPAPKAEPAPAPKVEPTPEPVKQAQPAPEPAPAPAPAPVVVPAAEPLKTEAAPEPAPAPKTEAAPAPAPKTEPTPAPAPKTEPAPAPATVAAEPAPAPAAKPEAAAPPVSPTREKVAAPVGVYRGAGSTPASSKPPAPRTVNSTGSLFGTASTTPVATAAPLIGFRGAGSITTPLKQTPRVVSSTGSLFGTPPQPAQPETPAVVIEKFYTLSELQQSTLFLPKGIDLARKEQYLVEEDFQGLFKMSKADFNALPQWKRLTLRKQTGMY